MARIRIIVEKGGQIVTGKNVAAPELSSVILASTLEQAVGFLEALKVTSKVAPLWDRLTIEVTR